MKTYLKTKDYAVSGEEFSLVIDEGLGLLKTDPAPENLEIYYEHESYISHTDRSKSIVEKVYQQVKKYNLRKKESWLKNHLPPASSVLDIGAGTGSFVDYLRSEGWKSEGVEPSEKAREVALNKGVDLYPSLDQLPDVKYNAITLWHVMEHFKDFDKEIDHLLLKLQTKGTLFIAVPNFRSEDAQLYKMYWAGYDVPRHLWHFSQEAMTKIFNAKGWHIVETKPMLFDSFYVSLLSEQYRKRNFIWWRALWRGLSSNFYGWRTGQYSSMVYILKKD